VGMVIVTGLEKVMSCGSSVSTGLTATQSSKSLNDSSAG